jgi:FlaA1/EpsC-like NDP-sugar epimerase
MRFGLDLRDERLLRELLGRESREVSAPAARGDLAGRCVLVTGAGGSVGSELVRQLAEQRLGRLVLVDHSEYALFRIEQEILERAPRIAIEPVLADVTRGRQMRELFSRTRPSAVFHAAAYKHVGMMERDVLSALRANVFGSLNVATPCSRIGARFLLVSSDKAANPRSVMGASKRLAELAVLAAEGVASRAAIVRFGNVLASSGSVLELMLDRIRRGLPVLVTDPLATRYFMTPREAVGLVLEADRLGRTGEVFWLDMGAPVGILDLANRLRALAVDAGLPDVPVEFIGLRPGEKQREELTVQGLELLGTAHPSICVARQAPFDAAGIRRCLSRLRGLVRQEDASGALAELSAAVPEYVASEAAIAAATARRTVRSRPPEVHALPASSEPAPEGIEGGGASSTSRIFRVSV